MASRKPSRAAVAGLRKTPLDEIEGIQLEAKLRMESDRGCVLVAAAAVDEEIELFLRQFLEKASASNNQTTASDTIAFLLEKEPVPPLGSFGIRIHVCYVLGIINDEHYRQLKILGSLRNAFAHFAEPVEITQTDVLKFTTPKKWTEDNLMRYNFEKSKTEEYLKESGAKPFSEPRNQFMYVAARLVICLKYRRQEVLFGYRVSHFRSQFEPLEF